MNKKGEFVLITPINVANNFIQKAMAENVEVTPLKLQKLVYFLFAKYLSKTGDCLFNERFETWTRGPVVPSIYAEFSSYGSNPIKTYAKDSMDEVYKVKESGAFAECIDDIWRKYKNYTGIELSNITHKPGMAWTKANEAGHQYLDLEDIKADGMQS